MNTIFTIGHSIHTLEKFISLLHSYKITSLAEVRSLPGSNRYPHFNKESLEKSLEEEGIKYYHISKLGGLRKTNPNSINLAWNNKSFRGYADYMQTKDFTEGLEELLSIAKNTKATIMCSEAVPWRCHRSLIGDVLLIRKIVVQDIFSGTIVKPHLLTLWAKVDGFHITYPKT